MHIRDMLRPAWQNASHQLHQLASERSSGPVAMEVLLEQPVTRDGHLMDGVRQIKETSWYRALRKRGLHFVPLGYRHGAMLVAVGTAGSLGAAYLMYKRLKKAHGTAHRSGGRTA